MKKILLAFGAVALLAAGCAQTGEPTAGIPTQQPQSGAPAVPVQPSNITINGVDDAVNTMEKNSNNAQSMVPAGDDSDLTASDSSDLNNYPEVPNDN